ncbi:WecB/TagA/CpsF family glycosyltransferase [Arthrobacter sp. H5]|uniref:WecB/TagA/CpsF family glycosyltransferase n=1 Tax=Arthrobacter sp. H5 TaxID=1267973 RepID=UPI000685D412|nr:WecB/TagA/CpsF family glycosyltransferase [Arthrobacter sp. H5]
MATEESRPTLQINGARFSIGQVALTVTNPVEAVQRICDIAARPLKVGQHVHFINAYTISLVQDQIRLRSVFEDVSINLPDGKPLYWIGRFVGKNRQFYQVRGPQFFLDTFDYGRKYNLRHFLLGSTPDVLEKLETNLKALYPAIKLVGSESPPFHPITPAELKRQDIRISESGAHIVWVGLGTPKQDFEAYRISQSLPVVAIAIGAAFDFTAGTIREAPSWMKKIGLEWMFRLLSEPKRLWRRYLIGNLRFIRAVVKRGRHDR